jgi:hypothetical protein
MAFAASARASLLVVVVAAGLLATACGCIYEHGTTGEAAVRWCAWFACLPAGCIAPPTLANCQ